MTATPELTFSFMEQPSCCLTRPYFPDKGLIEPLSPCRIHLRKLLDFSKAEKVEKQPYLSYTCYGMCYGQR